MSSHTTRTRKLPPHAALDDDRAAFIAALNEATPEVGERLRAEVFDAYRGIGEPRPLEFGDVRGRVIEGKLRTWAAGVNLRDASGETPTWILDAAVKSMWWWAASASATSTALTPRRRMWAGKDAVPVFEFRYCEVPTHELPTRNARRRDITDRFNTALAAHLDEIDKLFEDYVTPVNMTLRGEDPLRAFRWLALKTVRNLTLEGAGEADDSEQANRSTMSEAVAKIARRLDFAP